MFMLKNVIVYGVANTEFKTLINTNQIFIFLLFTLYRVNVKLKLFTLPQNVFTI